MLQRQSKNQHFSKQETEQNNYYLMILELENIWSRSVKFTAQIVTRAWCFLAEFTLFLFFCLYIYPSDMKGFQ